MQAKTIAVAAAAVAAATLLLAGCGGSGGGTTTSATENWADGMCSATATWQSSLQETADSVKNGTPTRQKLQSAATDAIDATQTYLDTLGGLGKPDTQAGQEAKASVDRLRTQLKTGLDTMQSAIDGATGVGGVVNAVSVVTNTLVTMRGEVRSTVDHLQQLDAGDELKQAFSDTDSCSSLKD